MAAYVPAGLGPSVLPLSAPPLPRPLPLPLCRPRASNPTPVPSPGLYPYPCVLPTYVQGPGQQMGRILEYRTPEGLLLPLTQ